MSALKRSLSFAAVFFALGVFTGCESTDGGGGSVSGGVYYGVGFYDPWYYGGYDDIDIDIDIDRPDRPDRPPRPEHPIARPTPSPRPTPSIPSSPRPMPRGGGGGGRR
jgi:hypothetical protein